MGLPLQQVLLENDNLLSLEDSCLAFVHELRYIEQLSWVAVLELVLFKALNVRLARALAILLSFLLSVQLRFLGRELQPVVQTAFDEL